MAITVVVGPPCAGKSTWIGEQKQPDDVVVDFDRIASALGSQRPHAAPGAVREVAFAARRAAITRVLGGVEADAWIIHTSPWPGQMARYADAGAEIVLLDPGIEECLARAEADGRPEGTADAIRAWYDNPPLAGAEKRERRMRTKDCPARVKAAGADEGLDEGQFTALVSVFGNEDSVGDVVLPGAFSKTLADWGSRGDPIPVIWSHDWGDPFSHIGSVSEAKETPAGLLVTGRLDLDNPKAAQVFRLLKGRRVTQFSFAYDIEDAGFGERDGRDVYELRQLKLLEVGPTLVGANQETELLAAKAAGLASGVKAGRVLSQANYERLTQARDAISEVLDSADPEMAKRSKTNSEKPGQPGDAAADGVQPSAQPAPAPPAKSDSPQEDTDSSTQEETTPDLREAPPEGAAKAGAAASRLLTRLDLDLLEAGV